MKGAVCFESGLHTQTHITLYGGKQRQNNHLIRKSGTISHGNEIVQFQKLSKHAS